MVGLQFPTATSLRLPLSNKPLKKAALEEDLDVGGAAISHYLQLRVTPPVISL